jgi:hypothetical protein
MEMSIRLVRPVACRRFEINFEKQGMTLLHGM